MRQKKTVAQVFAATLAWLAISVQAAPVAFTSQQYETTATAIAGSVADVQQGDSDSSPLPLITSAVAFDASDYAGGGAIAAQGLLSTTAEASSALGFASATGTAGFTGEFSGSGIFTFEFSYLSENFADANTSADSTFSFMLASNGATLLSLVVPVTDFFSLSLQLPQGASNVVSLFLTSEAAALTAGGSAQNVASVAFQVTQVPEPTTWLLLLAGLMVVAMKARAGSRAPWHGAQA